MSSLPRLFSRIALVALVALVGVGCTAPGVGRLQNRAPKDLPKALRFVPGDAMGWMLIDTDGDSERWVSIDGVVGGGTGAAENNALWERVFGTEVDPGLEVEPWIGSHAGLALLGVDINAPDSQLAFAEVRSRAKLEDALQGAGWKRAKQGLGSGDAQDELTLYSPASTTDSKLSAIAVADNAMIAAASRDGLEDILARTNDYAANQRKATNDYSVLAMRRTPFAVIFRSDIVRDQLRRFNADNPALLEMTGWAVRIPFLSAMRDGWMGIAPPVSPKDSSVRIIGSFDWLKDIADPVRPKPVRAGVLDELPSDTTAALAIHNPGQYAANILNTITANGSNFATKLDRASATSKVQLFDLLDDLNGAGAIAMTDTGTVSVRVATQNADDLVGRIDRAAGDTNLPGITAQAQAGAIAINVHLPPTQRASATIERDIKVVRSRDLAAAGTPPRTPVAWLWMAHGRQCASADPDNRTVSSPGPIVGWLTWDGTIGMTYSVAISVDALVCQTSNHGLEPSRSTFQSLVLGSDS